MGRRGTVDQIEAVELEDKVGRPRGKDRLREDCKDRQSLTLDVYDCCLFGQIYLQSIQKGREVKVEGREGGGRNNLVVK
jgi:hypothetical protein